MPCPAPTHGPGRRRPTRPDDVATFPASTHMRFRLMRLPPALAFLALLLAAPAAHAQNAAPIVGDVYCIGPAGGAVDTSATIGWNLADESGGGLQLWDWMIDSCTVTFWKVGGPLYTVPSSAWTPPHYSAMDYLYNGPNGEVAVSGGYWHSSRSYDFTNVPVGQYSMKVTIYAYDLSYAYREIVFYRFINVSHAPPAGGGGGT